MISALILIIITTSYFIFDYTKLKLTKIQKGLPLVSLPGQLVRTHELLKLPLGHVLQNVLKVMSMNRKVLKGFP